MKLVGVLPLTIELAEKVPASWGNKRYERPAGFTGAWYTETTPSTDWQEILLADVHYVLHRTLPHDLRLLYKTPSAWYNRRKMKRGLPAKTSEQWQQVITSRQ